MFRAASDIAEESGIGSEKKGKKPLWLRRNIKTIEYPKQKSFFKILSGSKVAKSGQNGSVLWDELGELVAEGEEAWQRLYNCGKYRTQPVWFAISTPQYTRNSLWWQEWTKAHRITKSLDDDPDYLAVIHGVPDDCEWQNPDNWWQHLEGLGDCVDRAYYLKEYETAKYSPRDLCRFRNHLLCQPTESIEQWLPLDKIEACFTTFDETTLHGKRCFLGLDGAISDLAAYVLFFPESGHVICRFFQPEITAERSDSKLGTHLIAWGADNHIKITDGGIFDWDVVKASLIQDCKNFDVVEAAFDPTNLESRLIELQSELPCRVIPVNGQPATVGPPTKHLERLLISGELKIQNNPCMQWCLQNAAIKDRNELICLDREKSAGRYDGTAALILALHRHLANQFSGDAEIFLL